jgi:hypothetical protein
MHAGYELVAGEVKQAPDRLYFRRIAHTSRNSGLKSTEIAT